MASVVLKHLEKKYPNGYHAVRDVNLEIADGEFMVLVGPPTAGLRRRFARLGGDSLIEERQLAGFRRILPLR